MKGLRPSYSKYGEIQDGGFLNKDDNEYYQKLKKTLSFNVCRNCRNKRAESFNEILSTIYYFINRKSEDSWKRSLVCGICWYKNYICISIRQLSYLLNKCKSSINGSLQRLFYIILPNKQKSMKILMDALPYLKHDQKLLHMWSVREYVCPTPAIFPIYQANQSSQIMISQKYQSASTEKTNQKEIQVVINNENVKPQEIKTENKIKYVCNENDKNLIDFADLFQDNDLYDPIF